LRARRITVVASEILGMPGTGGAATADSLLAIALGRSGHRVELLIAPGREPSPLSAEWEERYTAAGVQIRRARGSMRVEPRFLHATHAVYEALRSDPPEVVVADDWRGPAYLALRSRQVGAGFIATAFVVLTHGPARVLAEFARKVPDTLARFGEEVTERGAIALADVVVSPSEWLLGWMRDHRWELPTSTRVVPYVWQSVAFDEAPAQAVSGRPVRRLAFFGQLREGKGVRIFAESLHQVDPQFLKGLELVFLGRETPRWTADHIRAALSEGVLEHVAGIRFEVDLDRSAALESLRQPGTLAVMPSLLDNSPNAVSECIEQGVPFVAAGTGGIPELVAAEDRARVLCRPSATDLASALTRALTSRPGFAPAAPARPPRESIDEWLDVIDGIAPKEHPAKPARTRVDVIACGTQSQRRAQRLAERARAVDVSVVPAQSRSAGVDVATADWILFLDDKVVPDEEMLDTLFRAQAVSGADVVTTAVRPAEDQSSVHLFLGDPGALGLIQNQYGVVGLVRRSLATTHVGADAVVDSDWLLFARSVLGGARAVSVPIPLATHAGRLGAVGDVPGDGLLVLEAFEERDGSSFHDLAQLAATLGAALQRSSAEDRGAGPTAGLVERALELLRTEGLQGAARRLRRKR
jgi:glycosyltransferase involved in cell wall biosynthesis